MVQEFKLTEIADNLELRDGIWFSKSMSKISYPTEGNLQCYRIEEDSWWFKHRNNCIAEVVKKFCSLNSYFFDIGGGNGYVTSRLKRIGIRTFLVEPGVDEIFNAEKRGLKNLICSTLEDAQFHHNSISAIGAFDVIEHMKDDIASLSKIREILTKEGKLFLTVPAFNILWSDDDNFAEHIRRYTLKSMTEKLEKIGFAIGYATYIFSILVVPIFLFRTVPSKIGIKKDFDSQKLRQEYVPPNEITAKLLDKIWAKEISCIQRKKRISIGSSCLVVASKK